MSDVPAGAQSTALQYLRRKDILAGMLFIAIAAIGLWASRNYPIGTATRMGTGYVPRLLCWILLGLGVVVFIQGLFKGATSLTKGPSIWRAIILIPAALLAFAYTIQPYGVVVAIVLMIAVGSFASRESRPVEVVAAAVILVVLTISIFVWAIGLPISVWPEW